MTQPKGQAAPKATPAPITKDALSLLGIQISRRTDILAAAAFLISITGIFYQIYGAVQGPSIVQFPPEQLLFFPEEIAGGAYVHGAAQVSYTNKGRVGNNAVIKAQRMIIELNGRTYEWKWQAFQRFWSDKDKLAHSEPEPAFPTVISAGEAFSRETHFAPRTIAVPDPSHPPPDVYKNYLRWDDFVSGLSKTSEVQVRIVSEFYGAKEQEMRVFFPVTQDLIKNTKRLRWAAPSCWQR